VQDQHGAVGPLDQVVAVGQVIGDAIADRHLVAVLEHQGHAPQRPGVASGGGAKHVDEPVAHLGVERGLDLGHRPRRRLPLHTERISIAGEQTGGGHRNHLGAPPPSLGPR
jgi:hypothetical protein